MHSLKSADESADDTESRPSRTEAWLAALARITFVEVIVIVVIVGLFVLIGLFALPRRRETARLSGCRRNLMQIGIALALYDDSEAQLPSVPVLGLEGMRCDSPLGRFSIHSALMISAG